MCDNFNKDAEINRLRGLLKRVISPNTATGFEMLLKDIKDALGER